MTQIATQTQICTDTKMENEVKHKELTDKIIKSFYDVYNELGYGFLEKVYQNSLYIELKSKGFKVEA